MGRGRALVARRWPSGAVTYINAWLEGAEACNTVSLAAVIRELKYMNKMSNEAKAASRRPSKESLKARRRTALLRSSQSRSSKASGGNQLDARCAPQVATDCVPPRPRHDPVAAPTAGASAAQRGQNRQQNHNQYHKQNRNQCLKNQK